MRAPSPHLSIVLAEIGFGGVGKMRMHLANALVRQGYRVDLVLGHAPGGRPAGLDDEVPIFELGTSHAWTGVPRLAAYLWQRRPAVMLGQRIRVAVLMQRARRLARLPVRLYTTVNTDLHRRFAYMEPGKASRQRAQLRRHFPRLDGVFAISRGVAASVAEMLPGAGGTVPVLPNPVLPPGGFGDQLAEPPHPWLKDKDEPVIMGMGRLQQQKDFPTLLQAFARLCRRRPARLIILGEGEERARLWRIAEELSLTKRVELPGRVADPRPWLTHADVFVLSSLWEGLSNALIEAMAVGTSVVATDCPSGPVETLEDGRYGPLVAPGDDGAMAEAIETVLEQPMDPEQLRRAVGRFNVEASAEAYARALGLPTPRGWGQ